MGVERVSCDRNMSASRCRAGLCRLRALGSRALGRGTFEISCCIGGSGGCSSGNGKAGSNELKPEACDARSWHRHQRFESDFAEIEREVENDARDDESRKSMVLYAELSKQKQ